MQDVHLAKLEHLDINGFLLQLGQLVLSGSLVLEQLYMLMLQLPLCCLQTCPLLCQFLQRTPGLHFVNNRPTVHGIPILYIPAEAKPYPVKGASALVKGHQALVFTCY